jgi:hypothetical protein
VFGITPAQARESAERRADACEIVIEVTDGKVADPAAAWSDLTEHLRACYASVARAMADPQTVS